MSDTTTLWEVDKEATIAAFVDYIVSAVGWYGTGMTAQAEDLFAEIQGRERTFRQTDALEIGDGLGMILVVLVEVSDE